MENLARKGSEPVNKPLKRPFKCRIIEMAKKSPKYAVGFDERSQCGTIMRSQYYAMVQVAHDKFLEPGYW